MENPKKYPDFDFKPLKNTQIAIFRAVLGKMASIFQKFSRRSRLEKILKSEFYTLKIRRTYLSLYYGSAPPGAGYDVIEVLELCLIKTLRGGVFIAFEAFADNL